jgi:7-cyano-7-deazaguanine synthase
MNRSAVVLLSGGLDSAVVLAMAKSEVEQVYAMSFDYGQKHARELNCAKQQADIQQVNHHLVFPLNLRLVGGSALTADIEVPKDRELFMLTQEIPSTYVPARNLIFLSIATAWAETLTAKDIYIGVNAIDYSGYPDCRSEFIQAFEHAANLGTKTGVGQRTFCIKTPLINMTKAEIIRKGIELGVDFSATSSCYDPLDEACGRCDACLLRLQAFEQVGISDPIPYQ